MIHSYPPWFFLIDYNISFPPDRFLPPPAGGVKIFCLFLLHFRAKQMAGIFLPAPKINFEMHFSVAGPAALPAGSDCRLV
ncbi:hypothetical protein A6M21_07855 [Desulfotomaculum copahuensis]|uniref:Uncharacterized protein n=1 Tax=Desulfotomaculum copahuensis TaxID=1838280 RepID=A0A1B7LFW6_9FIRM|nr:hypothetical protein A6M21_07855 [Desulfotomaculum copahuensis]